LTVIQLIEAKGLTIEVNMASMSTGLEVNGLGRQAMSELTEKAKRLGITPERYVKDLVREDLELDRKVRTTTIREVMGPGQVVDEAELDRLVEKARVRHHRRTARKR
jgi:predicted ATPase with chaperone activity